MTFPIVENATKFKSGQSETYDGDAVGRVGAMALGHFVSDQTLIIKVFDGASMMC